jgi:isopentenyl phosphate kinase
MSSAAAAALVEAINATVMGGHPNYLKIRSKWIRKLAQKYGVPFKDLEKVVKRIENSYAPWMRVARERQKLTRPIIVKLGGSVITDKRKKFTARRAVLRRLANELTAAKGPLIIVHGGGSFGHAVASEYDIVKGYRSKRQLMGFSLTHRAMEKLNAHVVNALHEAGIPSAAIQPSACAVVSDGRIKSMELTPVRKLLELGIVPVLYGDATPDVSRGMSILSGDQLAVYLARELGASRVIFGVDVDGVYAAKPKVRGDVELVRVITPTSWRDIAKSIGTAGGADVTGGMANKVRELLTLAESGIEAEIVNAAKPDILKRAILGERGLGTTIRAG